MTSGLVGWWKLDDENSIIYDYSENGNDGKLYGNSKLLVNFDDGTANDKTAYGNNGTVYGASWNDGSVERDCISGGCYEFDGLDDYVDFGDGTLLNNSCDFSIGGWFKAESYGDFKFLFGIGDSRPGLDPFYVRFYNSSVFDLAVTDTINDVGVGIVWYFNSSDIPVNNWNQYFITLDSDSLKLYMNGNLVREAQNSNNICLIYDQAMPAQIGSIANWVHFNGSLDEVSVYSKTLTEEEVNDLYISQEVKFIEFKDSPLDKAVEFDGIDDYIEISDDDSLDVSSNLTIFASVKHLNSDDSLFNTILRKENNYVMEITSWNNPRFAIWDLDSSISSYGWAKSNLTETYSSLVGVYNGSNIYFYKDNLLGVSSEHSSGIEISDSKLYIGSAWGTNHFFNGQIDEVRIYNRILSNNELSTLQLNSEFNTEEGLNILEFTNCNLIEGEKYEVFVATNTSTTQSYFIAK